MVKSRKSPKWIAYTAWLLGASCTQGSSAEQTETMWQNEFCILGSYELLSAQRIAQVGNGINIANVSWLKKQQVNVWNLLQNVFCAIQKQHSKKNSPINWAQKRWDKRRLCPHSSLNPTHSVAVVPSELCYRFLSLLLPDGNAGIHFLSRQLVTETPSRDTAVP